MKKIWKNFFYGTAIVLASFLLPYKVEAAEQRFIRGDINHDSKIDITDPIYTLNYLFQAGRAPECLDSGDVNDNGRIDVSDAVYNLRYQFLGGPRPPLPFPEPGFDTTLDPLHCNDNRDVVYLDKGGLVLDKSNVIYKLTQDVEGGFELRGSGSDLDGQGFKISVYSNSGLNVMAPNILIKDVNIEGINNNDETKKGIYIESNNVKLSDIEVIMPNNDNEGFYFRNAENIEVEDIKISNFGNYRSNGIKAANVRKIKIQGFEVIMNGRGEYNRGIDFQNCNDINFDSGKIENYNGIDSDAITFQRCDKLNLKALNLITQGNTNHGIAIYDTDGIIGGDISIVTNGPYSDGIFSERGNLDLEKISIATFGENSHGVASLLDDRIKITDSIIQTNYDNTFDIIFSNYAQGLISLINTPVDKTEVLFSMSPLFDPKLNRNWYLNTIVKDINNNPVPEVIVSLEDSLGNNYPALKTNELGRVPAQTLLASIQDKTGIQTSSPYKIQISKQGYIPQERTIDLTGNIDLEFILERNQ